MWRTLWTQTECVEPMSIIQLSKSNKSFFSYSFCIIFLFFKIKYLNIFQILKKMNIFQNNSFCIIFLFILFIRVILKNDFVPIIKVNRDKSSFIFGALFYCMDILQNI